MRHTLLRVTPDDLTLGEQQRTLNDLEDRSVITATVELPGVGHLGICCTHLDHKAEELREKQARAVLAACDTAFSGGRSVICGDLNTFDRRE